jgi:hypothetical protein
MQDSSLGHQSFRTHDLSLGHELSTWSKGASAVLQGLTNAQGCLDRDSSLAHDFLHQCPTAGVDFSMWMSQP